MRYRMPQKQQTYPKGFDISLTDIITYNNITREQLDKLMKATNGKSNLAWFACSTACYFRREQVEEFLGVPIKNE